MRAPEIVHQRHGLAVQLLGSVKPIDHAVQVGGPPKGHGGVGPQRGVVRLLFEQLAVKAHRLIDHLHPQRLELRNLRPAVIADTDQELFDHLTRHRSVVPSDIAFLADEPVAHRQRGQRSDEEYGDGSHGQLVTANPAASPVQPRLAKRLHGLASQPTFDLGRQLLRRSVALFRTQGHGLKADRFEGPRDRWPDPAGRREPSPANVLQDPVCFTTERRLPGQ